jgi:hypothetical protein
MGMGVGVGSLRELRWGRGEEQSRHYELHSGTHEQKFSVRGVINTRVLASIPLLSSALIFKSFFSNQTIEFFSIFFSVYYYYYYYYYFFIRIGLR